MKNVKSIGSQIFKGFFLLPINLLLFAVELLLAIIKNIVKTINGTKNFFADLINSIPNKKGYFEIGSEVFHNIFSNLVEFILHDLIKNFCNRVLNLEQEEEANLEEGKNRTEDENFEGEDGFEETTKIHKLKVGATFVLLSPIIIIKLIEIIVNFLKTFLLNFKNTLTREEDFQTFDNVKEKFENNFTDLKNEIKEYYENSLKRPFLQKPSEDKGIISNTLNSVLKWTHSSDHKCAVFEVNLIIIYYIIKYQIIYVLFVELVE